MRFLTPITKAVRSAVGSPLVPSLLRKTTETLYRTEMEKEAKANPKIPQALRLWLLARRKRTCAKRRRGDSAKSPAANREFRRIRLGRAHGLNTYSQRDRLTGSYLEGGVPNAARKAKEDLR